MEHSFSQNEWINRLNLARVLSICCFLLVLGCEKPEANPELKDPIYGDLMRESESAAKDADIAKSEGDKFGDDLSKLESRDPSRSVLVGQRNGKYKMEFGSRQRADYFKIRAEQRLQLDRREYLKAFEAKKQWPDRSEYANYQEMRKLQTSSRNWDDRVPKNTRNDKGGAKPQKGGEKKAEKPAEKAE